MRKTIYEIEEPLKLLDTEGIWRASIREGSGRWIGAPEFYEKGDVVVLSTSTFCDAERAGFSGYLPHSVEVPKSVFLEVADALRAGEIPRRDDD